ncbi:urea amidolyase associated protein UAAP1 [Actinotalea sp. JY-7876]|uniref:urea amidolyase associated protein UAAP1 n=1 Tax=Actinotalea sp. JY-7876 TaxID=2758442 RepID=UPI0015F66D42|nr:urea amidolyase associated protein UAAP1 [Actinotalea sp. JY-7876]
MAAPSTATTAGARDHARAQEAAAEGAGHPRPTYPASARPTPPEGVAAADLVWSETVAPGGYTHLEVAPGTAVRLTDLTGDACAHLLLFHAGRPWERLNVADTVKVQWQAYPTAGHLLLSDQGRALASITQDTSGRHDTLFGTSTRARNAERYGDGDAHGPSPAGRELLALAGAKHGLTRRDLPPSISFFQGYRVDDAGRPRPIGSAGAGADVTLVAELPLVVLVANTAHPLDPRPDWSCGPLDVVAWHPVPVASGAPSRATTPEGRRALERTAAHLATTRTPAGGDR